MNKIYRRLWSTARQCWVVASELTAARGKGCQTRGSALTVAVMLAATPTVLAGTVDDEIDADVDQIVQQWALQATFSKAAASTAPVAPQSAIYAGPNPVGQFVLTTDYSYANSTVSGDNLVVVGSRSSLSGKQSVGYGNQITTRGNNNTAIGYNVQITSGDYATGVGANAIASGVGTTSLGNDAKAYSENSIAVGSGATTYNGSGMSKVAIGGDAYAGSNGWTGAVALGGRSRALYDSVAIGYEASTSTNASGAVALGRSSVASESNTVSVGNERLKRRLVNVADGTVNSSSTDAVNGRQLQGARDLAQRGVDNAAVAQRTANSASTTATTANTTANTAKSTADQALVNSRLVSQVSTYGDVRIGAENTGTVLDVRNRYSTNRKISGVADATLNTASTDAVNGRQLNATNGNVTTAQSTANAAKTAASSAQSTANSAIAKADVLSGLIAQTSATGDVRLGGSSGGSTLDVRNSLGTARKINGVADATIGLSSSEAVTGRQLYATDQKVMANQGLLTAHTSQLSSQDARIDKNRGDVEALRSEFDNFVPDLDGVVKFDADGSIDLNGGKVRGLAAGDIGSASSTEAVNGGQLFATNQRLASVENQRRFFKIGTDEFSEDANSGWFGVAIGESAEASPLNEGGTAVGSFSKAMGTNSVALGRAALVVASATDGFALGARSNVEVEGGVALGASAQVKASAENGVALGQGSYADQANTLSVGSTVVKRRIVNVGRGLVADDAATIGQLAESVATLGGGAGLDAKGSIVAPTYYMQGGMQTSVGEALTTLNGAVVKNSTRVDLVEDKLRSVFQDSTSMRAGGLGELTFAGANGMVLSNVANGAIGPGSRDAINGDQLYSVRQELGGRIDGLEQRLDGRAQTDNSDGIPTGTAASGELSQSRDSLAQVDEVFGEPSPASDFQASESEKSPKSPEAKSDSVTAPTPQVDTADLEKMLARANEYTDGAIRGMERRLDKMDKRFDKMAAMSSAQTAMAMNTAGLATYNRLGAGVGYAEGESAMAIGYQRVLNDKGSATFSLNGAFTNSGEQSVGLGVGIGW